MTRLLPLLFVCACSSPWTAQDDTHALLRYALAGAALLGLAVGSWLGQRAEAARWRSKGEAPPSGGGRMLSGGRFFWVCAEDADPRARAFVAHMLTDVDQRRAGVADLADQLAEPFADQPPAPPHPSHQFSAQSTHCLRCGAIEYSPQEAMVCPGWAEKGHPK